MLRKNLKKILKKAVESYSIPAKELRGTSDICCPELHQIWNDKILKNCQFPKNLKLADITPVFKKDDKNIAKNCTPVSVSSKDYVKVSRKSCGYRIGFSAHYVFLSILERWKKTTDNKGFLGGVLMDHSKAFETFDQELLIAKLHA